MFKKATLEETEITDPKSGKPIRISTTIRMIYRKLNPTDYGSLRNPHLNAIIAREFVQNAGNVLHYFRLGKKGPRSEHSPPGGEKDQVYGNVAEIRGTSSFFFISAIKDTSIDVLTIQSEWLKPKYRGSAESPIELGDT